MLPLKYLIFVEGKTSFRSWDKDLIKSFMLQLVSSIQYITFLERKEPCILFILDSQGY